MTERLDPKTLHHCGQLALACVSREYPHSLQHVLGHGGDVQRPSTLHPAFYGCYDWHSAVHNHWALVRLLRHGVPGIPDEELRAPLHRHLTLDNLEREAAYFKPDLRATFERPYGLAWLLCLARELGLWAQEGDTDAPAFRKALAPLVTLACQRLTTWLQDLAYPVRSGEHSQTAFALGLAWDFATRPGEADQSALVEAIEGAARRFYLDDCDAPLNYEPSGHDFLSPALAEAELMARLLPGDDYALWLERFLPTLPKDGRSDWLPLARITDRRDPKLSHLDGLHLSRAWMLEGIAAVLPLEDPRRNSLQVTAARHARQGLLGARGEHYAGGHWLASFAIYWGTLAPTKPKSPPL
ncbi:MAG: DUF2891 domain-containing protein [Candidatus Competibacterales bacterium]